MSHRQLCIEQLCLAFKSSAYLKLPQRKETAQTYTYIQCCDDFRHHVLFFLVRGACV